MHRQQIRLIVHVVAFIGFVFLIGGTIGGSCSQPSSGGSNSSQKSPSGC